MKATTYYRIKLAPNGQNMLTEAILFKAAMSNGGKRMTLPELSTIGKGIKLQYDLYSNVSIEIIGDHLLHVDRKNGENWETILVIEEVEILEMDEETIFETKKDQE